MRVQRSTDVLAHVTVLALISPAVSFVPDAMYRKPPVPSVVPSSNCSVTEPRSVLAREDPSADALSAPPAQISVTRTSSQNVTDFAPVPVVDVVNLKFIPPMTKGSPVVGQPRTANMNP